jgi:hypothetical protein
MEVERMDWIGWANSLNLCREEHYVVLYWEIGAVMWIGPIHSRWWPVAREDTHTDKALAYTSG